MTTRYGFGLFPGQYGLVVYSKYPIAVDDVRTFQHFLWKDMPGAVLPDDPTTPGAGGLVLPRGARRLPAVLEVALGRADQAARPQAGPLPRLPPDAAHLRRRRGPQRHGATTTRSASGPTTSAAEGAASYIYDDEGGTGGLGRGQDFVIAGDQNADPFDGDSYDDAILQLLDHPRIQDPHPTSAGAVEATQRDKGINLTHQGPAEQDTADFADNAPGNLRADYVLPSERLAIRDTGVYWLPSTDPLFARLIGVFPFPVTDHRLVWLDVSTGRAHGR